MPFGLLALAMGVVVIIGVSYVFLYMALRGPRAPRAGPVHQSSDKTGHHTSATIANGGATLRSIAVGMGCALLLVLVLVIGMFAFVIWAFKDFTLF
jgi:hypothetical protein